MAKADLIKLAEKAMGHLERSKNFRARSDRQPHIFLIDKDNTLRQILVQINRKRKPTVKQLDALEASVDTYIRDLYGTFKNRQSKDYTYQVFGQPPSFKVLVTSTTGKGDVFRKIREIRSSRRNEIKLTKAIADIFKRDRSITEENLAHLFDLGHIEGSSVAEQRVQAALAKFTSVDSSGFNNAQLDSIISLAIQTKERSGGQVVGKDYIVTVADESFTSNQLKGSIEEKEFLANAQSVLSDFIENNVDWVNQKGSRSPSDIIIDELFKTAIKSGAKVSNPPKSGKKSERAKVTKTFKSKKPIALNLDASKVQDLPEGMKETRTNWNSLVSVINAKLAMKVMENMKFPRLVNRTGAFASSAKVVGVEVSTNGNPTFIFDYERNPYNVFDKTVGKEPWNTPARDPSALVSMSIREIVRGLATERFYTRRA